MTDEDSDETDDIVSMYERDDSVAPGESSSADESHQQSDEQDQKAEGTPAEHNLEAPTVEAGGDLEEVTGTFYVKYAQESSVTLHEVDTAKICTLVENPGLERHEILEGRLKAQPPMGVSYLIEEVDAQYAIPVEQSTESPTSHVHDIATEELDDGDAIAIEREGKGEIHILSVDSEQVSETAAELRDDEMTYKNAARYDDVSRVEIRTDEEDGVVSIRYMP